MAESNSSPPAGTRFGRTLISVTVGELVDQTVDVIIVPGNARAMLGAGPSGTLWNAAGEDVERELRVHSPFEIGHAVTTSSGRLSARGVQYIVHAIIATGLGEQPRKLQIPIALEAALDRVVEVKGRSVAIPVLGVSTRAAAEIRMAGAQVVIDTFAKHLRTRKHRIEHGILVSRFEDDRVPLETLLVRARERLWTE